MNFLDGPNGHALRVAAASGGFLFWKMTFYNFESVVLAKIMFFIKMTKTDNFFEWIPQSDTISS